MLTEYLYMEKSANGKPEPELFIVSLVLVVLTFKCIKKLHKSIHFAHRGSQKENCN